jgi:hypothetical protein
MHLPRGSACDETHSVLLAIDAESHARGPDATRRIFAGLKCENPRDFISAGAKHHTGISEISEAAHVCPVGVKCMVNWRILKILTRS